MLTLHAVTVDEDAAACDEIARLHHAGWPPFLMQNPLLGERWGALYERFADFQFVLRDGAGTALACGNAIPLGWDGTFDGLPPDIPELLARGTASHAAGETPNALVAIAAIVDRRARGQGVSRQVLERLRAIAAAHGLGDLLAPVRPAGKAAYPLAPFARYVEWRRDDGSPFDPWIRTHWRLGARPLGVAPRTLTIEGTPQEWHEWTGLHFPDSGSYIVAGALQPVEFDLEWNRGVYEDPNYWMRHALATTHVEGAERGR